MAKIVLSCFVLGGLGHALSVNICDKNQISDEDEVSINDLIIDHLKEIIWNKIKNWCDIENVKDAYELILWKSFLLKLKSSNLIGEEMGKLVNLESFSRRIYTSGRNYPYNSPTSCCYW
ncbi:hypothetical protein F8M41_019953 [Gigaspora margarita]|uniref:LAGLIDADG endonuclease n=1 Tax=Gigaspora margarita TaxID=4874 RepID=A0A8H4AJ90_GIGMA|nr:hypothetical protein F8M41_019953 [Gigaspora margarita]